MRLRGLALSLTTALFSFISVSAPATERPKLEWRTFYFWFSGSTFEFQERLDQEVRQDCSAENEGRYCFVFHTSRDEPCVAGTGSLKLLKRMEKLDTSPSGRGQFLVEPLPPPWAKMYPEAVFLGHRIDEYALVRGVRVYGPHCDSAEVFYWVHDFRILELNRYHPETGAKLPN